MDDFKKDIEEAKKQYQDYENNMKDIWNIKDAAIDLYEALVELQRAFDGDGGRCFSVQEQRAWNLAVKALNRAQGK